MSGIEVAGLAFGVLPVLIEVFKSYASVSEGLHTFRHYSKEVKSISRQLQVQNCIFQNHCRLLLRLVEDEKETEAMLEDATDRRWTSRTLNDRLSEVLKGSLEHCRAAMEEIREIIDDMKEMMKEFGILKAQKQAHESIGTAIKRLRKAIKISFNKKKYEKCLTRLRERNEDFSVLRTQISSFQQPTVAANSLVKHQPLPESFHAVHNASNKLHEALCDAWCCDDVAHRAHYAKLCLDAEVGMGVRLDLAITCRDKLLDNEIASPSNTTDVPIWLYVQSISTVGTVDPTVPSQILKDMKESLPVALLPSSGPSLKKKASSELSRQTFCQLKGKTKEKRVHFNDPASPPATPPALSPAMVTDFNLCQTKSICHYLYRNYRLCSSTVDRNCVGYLETSCQMYRHKFYLHNRDSAVRRNSMNVPSTDTIYSIYDVMQQEPTDFLEAEDQLRLALKMAQAMLQYNNTPWLSDRWRLSKMSYFGDRHALDETALKTLHLSSQISSPTQPGDQSANMEGIQVAVSSVSDEMRYGINNLPLFFLGIALLEIAYWKPLERNMIPRDENNQVYTARRLVEGPVPLGPEYKKIAQKCLQCNFGFGTKLSSKSLQTAVYNDVVCGLEGIIKRLAI